MELILINIWYYEYLLTNLRNHSGKRRMLICYPEYIVTLTISVAEIDLTRKHSIPRYKGTIEISLLKLKTM